MKTSSCILFSGRSPLDHMNKSKIICKHIWNSKCVHFIFGQNIYSLFVWSTIQSFLLFDKKENILKQQHNSLHKSLPKTLWIFMKRLIFIGQLLANRMYTNQSKWNRMWSMQIPNANRMDSWIKIHVPKLYRSSSSFSFFFLFVRSVKTVNNS